MQAQTINEIYRTVIPDEAISPDSPYYVDLNAARGVDLDLASQIMKFIRGTRPGYFHRHLVSGHRGSGKSTELNSLRKKLENEGFLVVVLDVEKTLDIADIEYLDLILAATSQIAITAREKGIIFHEALLNNIGEWFAQTLEIREIGESVEHRLDASLGVDAPLLLKLLAVVTGQIKSGSSTRKETRLTLENRLEEFISRVTDFINDITVRIKGTYKGLVLIVDSLEKMPLRVIRDEITNHSQLFIEHAEQLKSIPCHTIYTVPVSLLHERNLGIYTNFDLIPMISIATPDRKPHQRGKDLLFEVIGKRVNIATLFENPALVYQLIDFSGGVVRDLLRLLLFAATFTPDEQTQISEKAVESAIRKLTREYDLLIHKEDLPLLVKLPANPHLAIDDKLAKLMYNRLVLGYINGKNWLALHPGVQNSAVYKAYLGQQGVNRKD